MHYIHHLIFPSNTLATNILTLIWYHNTTHAHTHSHEKTINHILVDTVFKMNGQVIVSKQGGLILVYYSQVFCYTRFQSQCSQRWLLWFLHHRRRNLTKSMMQSKYILRWIHGKCTKVTRIVLPHSLARETTHIPMHVCTHKVYSCS